MEDATYQPFESDGVDEALKMANEGKGGRHRRAFWNQVHLCAEMARDTIKGDYDLGLREKALLIGGLLYVVSPLDAVPDMIPVAGLADDVLMIGAVATALALELASYKRWRRDDGDDPINTPAAA
jgi:uncharacterized membrane protein YkvA (DUF1232 family)